uniref:Calpain catalytic domain-containing protein n=1 Tax=Lotharella globosa TaxID=91324 RepID=A0A6V3LXC2_9EUKA
MKVRRGESYDDEKVWKLLEIYMKRQALMSCAVSNDGEAKRSDGIVAGHAYSILHAEKVGNYRMLQLRNPWGSFEWKGAWSDGDTKWKQHKDVARKLKYEDRDDGCFWMEFDDWDKIFDSIDICDRSANHDLALNVNEEEGNCGVVTGWWYGCCSFWCLCNGCWTLYCTNKTSDETAAVGGCCGC